MDPHLMREIAISIVITLVLLPVWITLEQWLLMRPYDKERKKREQSQRKFDPS